MSSSTAPSRCGTASRRASAPGRCCAGDEKALRAASITDFPLAATAGANALIVQGVEAGGHVQGVVGLLPLMAEVRRAVSLPLLAAGGIADPASARAALTAGAEAIVMGTRFWPATSATLTSATRRA